MLAKWGISSTFAGVVGNDVYGNRVRKELETAGVDTRYVETSYEKDTVLSFVLVDSKNKMSTSFDVADEFVKLKKFDFDFQPDLIVLDGNDTYASKSTIERFPKAVTILRATRFNQDIANLALKVNYLICSLDFVSGHLKMPIDSSNVSALVNAYTELRSRYEHQNIIITLGNNGAMYMVDDQIKISPSLKMEVVDTSGCGDIFTGAFSYGIANNYLPHLDLHGETTATIVYLIEAFIRDNVKLKNDKIIIIHGKGSGALRSKTHELLKRNKRVNKYYIDGLNDGQTVVLLNLK